MIEAEIDAEEGFSRVIIAGNRVLPVTDFDFWILQQWKILPPDSFLWRTWTEGV